MKNTMAAWVLHGAHDMRLEEREKPSAATKEVLVRIKSVGICGSDMHYYEEGRIGPFVVDRPLVLGHECSGEVVEIGSGVTRLKTGDRVVIEPGIPCLRCTHCKSGRYNKCRDIAFMATPPYDGCLMEYVSWPEDLVYRMPDSMDYETGAMVEPFCCGLASMRRGGFAPGSSAMILGAGPIGLMVIENLKAFGAGKIYAADVMPYRLEAASKAGAKEVLDAKVGSLKERVWKLTNGEGVDFVFETAGADATYYEAPLLARDGGTVVCLGLLVSDGTKMPMSSLVINEINLVSIFRYCNVFQDAIEIIVNRGIDLSPVLTHRFSFKEADAAFSFAVNNKQKSLKVMINY